MSKSKNKSTSLIAVVISLLLIATSLFTRYGLNSKEDTTALVTGENDLIVHFLDVGQGDSEFVELPNGDCMLIDAGESTAGEMIVNEISALGYDKIDYIIATHPHADHIGGMTKVLESFEVEDIIMPKAVTDTKTYENLLTAIKENGLKITTAQAGKVIYADESIEIKLLAPVSNDYEELNNFSAVVKISYGKNSFLFTGDAEEISEQDMLSNNADLNADVLKVGHHGSKYSSSEAFLDAVTPDYAVIECGVDNVYNHPHTEAIERLENAGAEIYRTDLMGDIVITCDGNNGFEVN